MTETLPKLLLRLSEAGDPAILWGRQAAPHAGRDFERLLDRGVLVEQAQAMEWDVCATCDCGLEARPIERVDGRNVAVCPIDRRCDVVLDGDDLRSFRIHPLALVREISAASGLPGAPTLIAPGIWHLGLAPNKRALFLALSTTAGMQPGLLPLLRSVAKASAVTLLTPAMSAADQVQFAVAGTHVVPTIDVLAPSSSGVSFGLQLDELTPRSTAEPVLVLMKSRQSIMLDGDEMTLPQRSFDLLWLLSEVIVGGGGVVTRRQIEQHLWGHQVVSKTAAADAVRDLRKQLAGRDARPDRRELVETRQGKGYILALPTEVIQLVS